MGLVTRAEQNIPGPCVRIDSLVAFQIFSYWEPNIPFTRNLSCGVS